MVERSLENSDGVNGGLGEGWEKCNGQLRIFEVSWQFLYLSERIFDGPWRYL